MKQILIFLTLALAVQNIRAASCPTGFSEIDNYGYIISDGTACPSGYAATTDYKFVDDSASCGSGYSEVKDFTPSPNQVYTDSKGSLTYQCVVS